MKIAITSENGNGLNAPIAGHFGHAPVFTMVEIEDNKIIDVVSVENPFLQGHAPGQVPKFINEQGANGIITGGMGSRAITFFEEFGIKVYSFSSGTVDDAVKMLIDGKLETGKASCGGGDHGC
ncbi:NifB/NifX family molybdenum-iron cluster-binding protein [bacterium]|nr:NifB/NifX family molybdenum-iron cluster-binding protein [bacterium]